MEIIKHDTNFDFIKYRNVAVFGSITVNLLILVGVFAAGLNLGVDFAGGSELEARFAKQVSAEEVRKSIEKAGFKEPQVQEYGAPEDHAFLIRIHNVSVISAEQAKDVEASVRSALGPELAEYRFDPDQGDKFEMRT